MEPRSRVELALRGGRGDRVPFTMYENKIPPCAAERHLRNRGLCIIERNVPVFRTHWPNCKIHQHISWEHGRRLIRTHYDTPSGQLSSLEEDGGFTTWFHEHPFKSPDDYPALLALIRDEQYEPDYATFLARQEELGEDFILRAGFGLEPLQMLISGHLLGMEDFCVQWAENRDELLKLYEAIVANRRRIYPLVAESPALHANYGGNVVVEVIGPKVFQEYYLPHYQEAAEILHRRGRLIGCHFDDDCRLLAPLIAESGLDYIEAFTPWPDTDMTLADARRAWPGKVLWINFPSSQHLKTDEEIERITMNLLDQAGNVAGLLMGITEDIPPQRWRSSCSAIMSGLERHARERPGLYR